MSVEVLGMDQGQATSSGPTLLYKLIVEDPAASSISTCNDLDWESEPQQSMLTTGTSGTKNNLIESWTGVALRLALLLQGGSWTISPAIRAGGGEDQVTDAVLCSWIIHYHQGQL